MANSITRKETEIKVETHPRLDPKQDIGEVLGKLLHRAATMQLVYRSGNGRAHAFEEKPDAIITDDELEAIARWFTENKENINKSDPRMAYVYLIAQLMGANGAESFAPVVSAAYTHRDGIK